MPYVQVLRPFANRNHEDIVQPGDIIMVSEDRKRDLGDLVADLPTGVKIAPVPENKMEAAPVNKAVSVGPVVPRRGRGRPPGTKSGPR